MDLIEKFQEYSKCLDCTVEYNVSMSLYTTFKTGGDAEILVSPKNENDIINVLKFCKDEGIKPIVIGNGSNLLVKDCGIKGVVIHIGRDFDDISILDDDTICCTSGTSMAKLCKFALDNELTGLEFAYGIPGSVGGGAFMNAGAYGGELKDVIVKCEHIDFNGNKGEYSADELNLSYRSSVYKDSDKIITKIYLRLNKGDKAEIKSKMDELMQKRKDKQPLEYPSAGSTFKRPEGFFAGKLIQDCGLKGACVGGAQVSEKHSGFIINTGDATSADILRLIGLVQDAVLAATGIFLETEVRII